MGHLGESSVFWPFDNPSYQSRIDYRAPLYYVKWAGVGELHTNAKEHCPSFIIVILQIDNECIQQAQDDENEESTISSGKKNNKVL